MRRVLILLLLAALLCGSGSAGGWADGRSPQKPYLGSPEVDFEKTFGYMLTLPLTGSNVLPGVQSLRILVPREDVETGSGTLRLYSEENGLEEEIEVTEETLTRMELTEAELDALMWGCGTAFVLTPQNPLQANRHYYVQMTPGIIHTTTEGACDSGSIVDITSWSFTTAVDSYAANLQYIRSTETPDEFEYLQTPKTGDAAKLDVVLERGIAAAVYCDQGQIIAENTYLTKSGSLRVSFPEAGEVRWGIVFLTSDGELYYSIDYVSEVEDPAAEPPV